MDTERTLIINKRLRFTAAVLIMAGLYLSSRYHYLLFHSFAEIFSIVIAFGIFMITWNARQFIRNGYFLFVGTAYLFIGFIDLVHTLSFKGVPIFTGYGSNLATQLWISARYMESLTLLVSLLLIKRRLRVESVFMGYALLTILIFMSIFRWNIFPVCFIEGTGLTPFKKISEYIISLILLTSLTLLLRYRREFDDNVLRWIAFSIIFTISSELAFTFYVGAYDFSNLIGHYLKILSFYCMYKAIIESSLTKPYNIMFRELKQNEERYRSLFTNMIDGGARNQIVFDENGNPVDFIFLEVNDAFEEMTGLKREEIVGKKITEVQLCARNEIRDWITKFGNISKTGESARFESFLEPLNKYYSVMVYSHERGYFVTIFEDITERKRAEDALKRSHDHLEKAVKERTAELKEYAELLEMKNKELEEFAYVASHDLQEPLRKIQVFGSKLEDLEGKNLSKKSLDYIYRMIKATNRMRKLVQDLLAYSRISLKAQPYDTVDLNKALQGALENLEAGTKQTGADIKVDKLPVIEADFVQMMQLFQNLIGNALKFSGNNHPIKIEVIYQRKTETYANGKLCEIHIKDNGIGFSKKYAEKIFQPFERLDQKGKNAEGTGIGLAICRRIVERHGGSISAKSVPGKGSTFIVILPVSQTED